MVLPVKALATNPNLALDKVKGKNQSVICTFDFHTCQVRPSSVIKMLNNNNKKKRSFWVNKMVQQVKVPVAKPGDLRTLCF